ncbi:NAD(P)H-quinone oxidoreductase [Frondihabitans sp. 4ASC-45]|uniref:NAD(P)H-quinone oxidoreductase n=1 Tax=Frondihabitans sp. 4ASC-45 TaxID=3111636 RepID=UPI003C1CCF84
MRLVLISQPGGPEALVTATAPDPVAGPGELLIRVAAAGINRADVGQRQGNYPPPPGAPEWPGLEVSGTIEAIGPAIETASASDSGDGDDTGTGTGTGTPDWKVGDQVCALLAGGGYAELVAVDARLVLPVPSGVDLVEAAGLPEVAATVWSNVFWHAGLQPGETLLVHGGTSGIGTFAIQLATALGSKTIATAGSDAKVTFMNDLGAAGVNYRTTDFVEAAKQLTDGRGVDVILDLVGGDYLARNIDALAMNGRIMVIANQSGEASSFQLGALMQKRGRIWATTLRARPIEEKAEIVAGVGRDVWPLVERGMVKPIIDEVFPLDEAADAHRRMDAGGHIGKLLLKV